MKSIFFVSLLFGLNAFAQKPIPVEEAKQPDVIVLKLQKADKTKSFDDRNAHGIGKKATWRNAYVLGKSKPFAQLYCEAYDMSNVRNDYSCVFRIYDAYGKLRVNQEIPVSQFNELNQGLFSRISPETPVEISVDMKTKSILKIKELRSANEDYAQQPPATVKKPTGGAN